MPTISLRWELKASWPLEFERMKNKKSNLYKHTPLFFYNKLIACPIANFLFWNKLIGFKSRKKNNNSHIYNIEREREIPNIWIFVAYPNDFFCCDICLVWVVKTSKNFVFFLFRNIKWKKNEFLFIVLPCHLLISFWNVSICIKIL